MVIIQLKLLRNSLGGKVNKELIIGLLIFICIFSAILQKDFEGLKSSIRKLVSVKLFIQRLSFFFSLIIVYRRPHAYDDKPRMTGKQSIDAGLR